MSGFAFKLVPIVSTGRGEFRGWRRFRTIRCIAGSLITADLSLYANRIAKCPTCSSAEAEKQRKTNKGIAGWLVFISFICPKLVEGDAEGDRTDCVCNSNVDKIPAAFRSSSPANPVQQMATSESSV